MWTGEAWQYSDCYQHTNNPTFSTGLTSPCCQYHGFSNKCMPRCPLEIHAMQLGFKNPEVNMKLFYGDEEGKVSSCLQVMLRGITEGRKILWVLLGEHSDSSWMCLKTWNCLCSWIWQPSDPCGNFQPLPAHSWEVWTMPPPAGYVPVAKMWQVESKESIFFPKIHWNKQFCIE